MLIPHSMFLHDIPSSITQCNHLFNKQDTHLYVWWKLIMVTNFAKICACAVLNPSGYCTAGQLNRVKHLKFSTQESVPKFVEHEPLRQLICKKSSATEKFLYWPLYMWKDLKSSPWNSNLWRKLVPRIISKKQFACSSKQKAGISK